MTTKTLQQNFLQNLLDNELSLKGGYLNIPARGNAKIMESDLEEQSILYALGRGWAEILHHIPSGVASVLPAIEVEITEPYRGLTFEELQEEQAKKAKATEDAAAEAKTKAEEDKEEDKIDTSPIEEFFPNPPAQDAEPVVVKETKAKKVK